MKDTMTDKEFERAVALMRKCQRKASETGAWIIAWEWEKRVDAELQRRERDSQYERH